MGEYVLSGKLGGRSANGGIERNFDVALTNASRRIRPDLEPPVWTGGKMKDWDKGWWLMKHLEEAGFGHQYVFSDLFFPLLETIKSIGSIPKYSHAPDCSRILRIRVILTVIMPTVSRCEV